MGLRIYHLLVMACYCSHPSMFGHKLLAKVSGAVILRKMNLRLTSGIRVEYHNSVKRGSFSHHALWKLK